MALGIQKSNTMTRWDIPLFGGQDPDWNDNTWIVEHLRQLAQKIEEEQPRIMEAGMRMDVNYKIPHLFLEIYERREAAESNKP